MILWTSQEDMKAVSPERGVFPMSDYELLMTVFTVLSIIVILLIEYIKK